MMAKHLVSFLLSLFLVIGTSTISCVAQSSQSTDQQGSPPSSKKRPRHLLRRGRNSSNNNNSDDVPAAEAAIGKLEKLKQREAELTELLAQVHEEKLLTLRSRPLSIGIVGFGRFGQFLAKTFQKYGRVVATSRSNYTDTANRMGVKYVPLSELDEILQEDLDVIVVATSIMSFESVIKSLVPPLKKYLKQQQQQTTKGDLATTRGPLIVDVLSVKEHPRQVMLDLLPRECDILCTHPMFGPDSGKDGWGGLNFVYEKTRIDRFVLVQNNNNNNNTDSDEGSLDNARSQDPSDSSKVHAEAMDRVERFLSIWEQEGCHMVELSAKDHDTYAAHSQFITHLIGRILGLQGLTPTPIDTKGFQSVLKLIESTNADSFDLFYGLYKFNNNSLDTVAQLQSAMKEVVDKLHGMEEEGQQRKADQAEPIH